MAKTVNHGFAQEHKKKKKMKNNRRTNSENFVALERSMMYVHESLEQVKSRLYAVVAENIILKEECGAQKEEYTALKKRK